METCDGWERERDSRSYRNGGDEETAMEERNETHRQEREEQEEKGERDRQKRPEGEEGKREREREDDVVNYLLVMARTAGECGRRKSLQKAENCDHPRELHVLAVDDSHVDRKVIEHLLKISSCRVTAVESGTRALQYLGLDGERSSDGFEALKVNLIMTDYSMPGMTGYELLKKIKESSALREIPVVIMSSENIMARIDRCLEEGAEDFLLKPVKLADVKRLKDFVLGGQEEENGERASCKRKQQDDHKMPPPSPFVSLLPTSHAYDRTSTPIPSSSPTLLQSPSKRPRL